MSVLFLGPLPEPVTGQSLACQVLLQRLEKRERVEVVNLNKQEFAQGINSIGRIREVFGMVWRIWRLRNACDVIYLTISESIAGNLKDLLICLVCFGRLPCMVIHLHGGAGMREIMAGRKGCLLRAANAFFLRRLGGVIVLGERHVGIYEGVVARERIHVVPNFAQDHLFAASADVERKFELVEPLKLLFLSNLLPGKGHVELVDAFRALDEPARRRLEIDFAGGFESEAHRKAFAASIEGCAQIRYHGTVAGEAKRSLFAGAHVFCLPTYYPYEGQPISILEAYAAGCSVITTDHSGIFDIFADGVNGYAVEKQSARSLETALRRALDSPGELRTMAIGNLAIARQRYTVTQHTGRIAAVIDSMKDRNR